MKEAFDTPYYLGYTGATMVKFSEVTYTYYWTSYAIGSVVATIWS